MLIAIIVIIVLCVVFGKGKSKPVPKTNYYDAAKKQQYTKTASSTTTTSSVRITVSQNSFNNKKMDDSIIDVGNNAVKIDSDYGLSSNVPYWNHSYVYSYNEINYATASQKKFYQYFMSQFLEGKNLDIDGNTNYAFILMFDLLNNFDVHKDVTKLENQLEQLGIHYPKTKSYGVDFLIKKMQSVGDTDGIARLREDHYDYQSQVTYSTFEWRNKYKKKLNLKKDEINLMDKIWYSSNTFNGIEYCCIEIIKLYLEAMTLLQQKYAENGTTIEKQFEEVADIVVRKHFKYRKGSNNYKYGMQSCDNEFYTSIFKLCENAVREHYGHKRKINVDAYISTPEARAEFELKILNEISLILYGTVKKITAPDDATELKLNLYNTARWKIQFEHITANYGSNALEFAERIIQLGKLNAENPSVENIFFEASKFISKYDQTVALSLYIYYLDYDMKSATFDNKQLAKTIQKSLFKNEEQLSDFQKIVNEFISDKDLPKALNEVSKVYAVKRKKIKLDVSSIKEVQEQHSGTVELLNEYLKDENEVESLQHVTDDNEEIKIVTNHKTEEEAISIYSLEMPFKSIHTSALEIFSKNNFSILQSDFEVFAKTNGAFRNQLIESINEMCYERLDDLLIEEDEDYYTINQNYYQKLLA